MKVYRRVSDGRPSRRLHQCETDAALLSWLNSGGGGAYPCSLIPPPPPLFCIHHQFVSLQEKEDFFFFFQKMSQGANLRLSYPRVSINRCRFPAAAFSKQTSSSLPLDCAWPVGGVGGGGGDGESGAFLLLFPFKSAEKESLYFCPSSHATVPPNTSQLPPPHQECK